MKKTLSAVYLLIIAASSLFAKEVIQVEEVDFNSLNDDWVQMKIELSCEENPQPDARNPRFVEKIKVKVYLGYVRDIETRTFDYYTSEVEIVIMEQGDDKNVYFYLPGPIVERDRLKTDPDFYYVEISVDGKPLPPQKDAISSSIADLEILKTFKSKADSGSAGNDHILMPIYMVTGVDLGRVSDLPVFLRRDTRD